MKSYLKSILVLCLTALLFTSCQDEAIQIINPTEQEAIVANSVLSNLMLRTSANAVSNDNIIDNSDCFSVELPVTVIVGNITITIENEDGLDELEDLLEEFEGELPEFVFPITLISSDYSETVIENQDQLDNLLENCIDDDDVIECVDFVYPISFSILNAQFVLIDTVTIQNSEELYDFLEELEDGNTDFVALNFPVTLQYADGETVTVNSNTELSNAIELVDDCDDDDFYDCTVEEVKAYLKECKWQVDDLNDFDELNFVFNDDFTLQINSESLQESISGNWTVTETDNGKFLVLSNLSALQDDLEGQWLITDCDENDIDVVLGDVTVDFNRLCEEDLDCDAEDLSYELTECYWFAGSTIIGDLANKFTFTEDGKVKAYINNEFVEIGVWNVSVDADTLNLVLEFTGDYQALSGVWEVLECDEGFFGLAKGDTILHLEQECFDSNPFECYPEEGVELTKCDDNNDGFEQFNIYEAVPGDCNSNEPVTITFHTTLNGAENNTDFLEGATSYTNTSNPQTVYVKVALFNNPDEKLIYPVELVAKNCNQNPFDCFEGMVLESCDDSDGVAGDQVAKFDLTSIIENTSCDAEFSWSFHVSVSDAQSNTNAINNPSAYINQNGAVILRIEKPNGEYMLYDIGLQVVQC